MSKMTEAMISRAIAHQRLAAASHSLSIWNLEAGDIRKAIHHQKEARYFAEIAAIQVSMIK